MQKAGYQWILSQDLIDYVYRGGSLPEKPILLTFDDGYYSNYEFIFPILKKYNVKASIFIVTDNIYGKNCKWETIFNLGAM